MSHRFMGYLYFLLSLVLSENAYISLGSTNIQPILISMLVMFHNRSNTSLTLRERIDLLTFNQVSVTFL